MKNKILVFVALVCFLSNIEGVYSNFLFMNKGTIVQPCFGNVPTRPLISVKNDDINIMGKTPEIYQFQQKTPSYLQF